MRQQGDQAASAAGSGGAPGVPAPPPSQPLPAGGVCTGSSGSVAAAGSVRERQAAWSGAQRPLGGCMVRACK